MDIFNFIVVRIIKEQERIIGPLAWGQAKTIEGLKIIDTNKGEVEVVGDGKQVVDQLVARYDNLFGRASHEVSREAVSSLIADMPADQVPESLRG